MKIKSRFWKNGFATLMFIPQQTRKIYKINIPYIFLRLGVVFCVLLLAFITIMALDYINVLRGMSENKKLRGENFKLRRELSQIKNKVEQMDQSLERVRNYAKKLQFLTGQNNKNLKDTEKGQERTPATSKNKADNLLDPDFSLNLKNENSEFDLGEHIDNITSISIQTEYELMALQTYLLSRTAMLASTPSLIPTNGYISSYFGYRRHPFDGVYRLHSGIDIVADIGTPIRAPADGTVSFSGYKTGYGEVVVIDHGYGIHTLFAHNSLNYVTKGEKVKRGQIIARVGETGITTGPHLHYEVRKNGRAINPLPFITSQGF